MPPQAGAGRDSASASCRCPAGKFSTASRRNTAIRPCRRGFGRAWPQRESTDGSIMSGFRERSSAWRPSASATAPQSVLYEKFGFTSDGIFAAARGITDHSLIIRARVRRLAGSHCGPYQNYVNNALDNELRQHCCAHLGQRLSCLAVAAAFTTGWDGSTHPWKRPPTSVRSAPVEPFTNGSIEDVILLGMGGSSLSAEVFSSIFGSAGFSEAADSGHHRSGGHSARGAGAQPRQNPFHRFLQVRQDAGDPLAFPLFLQSGRPDAGGFGQRALHVHHRRGQPDADPGVAAPASVRFFQ